MKRTMPTMTTASIDLSTVTPFQRRVFEAALLVPRGKVTTYGKLAKAIGCNSARAVGQALRRNPFAPRVPCHRVIRGDFTIGGFAGAASGETVARKRGLLADEGVRFVNGKLADPERFLYIHKPGCSGS